jgi:uncharacterized protein YbbC (DUF1343 family)
MKYGKDTQLGITTRRYIKLLSIKSILFVFLLSCSVQKPTELGIIETTVEGEKEIKTVHTEIREEIPTYEYSLRKPVLGIDRLHLFVDSLKGKKIAVVGNQTSMVGNVHLVDTLLSLKLDVKKVFSPEHGFRGDVDAGVKVHSSVDEKTGIPLISLYGLNKKPLPGQLSDVDIVIYDIQDVGVRFYTYISTLHYVMEACAENKKQLVVLDRPNPNGHYVDGPLRDEEHKSFVGMHPVPIVYGMTIGEYALMINGEEWLRKGVKCNLWIIPCLNYTHKTKYILPVPPSPNLKSEVAISLYPSLCLFEATTVSIGRGTDRPFEVFGHPRFPTRDYSFKPVSTTGAKHPLHENKTCYGFDLRNSLSKRKYELNLNYLIQAKELLGDSSVFIDQIGFFNRLAGTSSLRQQLNAGWTSKEIRATWQPGLEHFKQIRQRYLLYE